MITQQELRRYHKLESFAKQFEKLKKDIVKRMRRGETQQRGKFAAHLQVVDIPVSVPWKQKMIDFAGEKVVESILSAQPRTERLTLSVFELNPQKEEVTV